MCSQTRNSCAKAFDKILSQKIEEGGQACSIFWLYCIALKYNDVIMMSPNSIFDVVFNKLCSDKIFTTDIQFKDFIDPIRL